MNTTHLLSSRMAIVLISQFLWVFCNAVAANEVVITDDGREVLLRKDGTWKYYSSDRFANTKHGQRVRLKADGSWQYMGNAPISMEDRVRTTELDIKLAKVVVEKHEKQVQKNKRVKTQTVFYLDIALSPLTKRDITISSDAVSLIRVKDSDDRNYPVLAIQPSPTVLKPDSNVTISVRADGSPQWWKGVKLMEITLEPGILGIQEPMTFSRRVSDFDRKDVKGFEY